MSAPFDRSEHMTTVYLLDGVYSPAPSACYYGWFTVGVYLNETDALAMRDKLAADHPANSYRVRAERVIGSVREAA